MYTGFMPHLLEGPLWVQIWVVWMILINSASVLFLRHREGQVVLAVWIANIVFMTGLYELNGYNRLLGLSHVIFWTPLIVWLLRYRRDNLGFHGVKAVWLTVLCVTNSLSLVIDYVDVVRYVLGDRS